MRARVVASDGQVVVQVAAGVEYNLEMRGKPRRNSVMTTDQLYDAKVAIDHGARPAAIVANMTSKELQVGKEQGVTKKKRPNGGLEGEGPRRHSYILHMRI